MNERNKNYFRLWESFQGLDVLYGSSKPKNKKQNIEVRLLKFLNEKSWIISFFKIGLMYPIMWEICCILLRTKSSMILGSESIAKFIFKWNPKHNHWKIKLSVRTNSKVLGINFPMSITMSFSIHYLREIYMYSKHISHRLYIEKHEMQVQHALE